MLTPMALAAPRRQLIDRPARARRPAVWVRGAVAFVALAASASAWAQSVSNAPAPASPASSLAPSRAAGQSDTWSFGAVLDVTHTSRALALGGRDRGLQLGHSDLSLGGPIGRALQAQLTAVLATHEGKLEAELEEAWVQTTRLPGGLSVRAGRFASQIGYLNAQHPHADDFIERPLLYRAFLGGHWNDDGLRLNWTAPTDLYWMVGAEVFRGRQLVKEAARAPGGLGAATLVTKVGGDWSRAHSWQLGLSHLHNRREAAVEDEHEHGEGAFEHDHAHGAAFSGKRTWLVDATWKWAPNGNNRQQQLRTTVEMSRTSGLNRFASSADTHSAGALSVVWRFHPHWETGARFDALRVQIPHDDHFHRGRLNEHALMLAYKPSHMQSLRLQLTQQRNARGIDEVARRSLALQYVVAFGAHGAHSY